MCKSCNHSALVHIMVLTTISIGGTPDFVVVFVDPLGRPGRELVVLGPPVVAVADEVRVVVVDLALDAGAVCPFLGAEVEDALVRRRIALTPVRQVGLQPDVSFIAIGLEQAVGLEVLDLVPVPHRDLVQLGGFDVAQDRPDDRQHPREQEPTGPSSGTSLPVAPRAPAIPPAAPIRLLTPPASDNEPVAILIGSLARTPSRIDNPAMTTLITPPTTSVTAPMTLIALPAKRAILPAPETPPRLAMPSSMPS